MFKKLFRSFNLQETFNDIEKYIKECEDQRDTAIQQMKEWNKDSEIQKLKEELENARRDLRSGFLITKEEDKEIKNWLIKHTEEKHNGVFYEGAIGGRYTYHFTPTSIGDIGEIVCNCGEKFCFREL
jgi:hypothetical protein